MPYDGPGIYRHYKGGHYRIEGLARHESTGQLLVIYHSYDVDHEMARAIDHIDFVARPLNPEDGDDAFNEPVTLGKPGGNPGFPIARFMKLA